MQPNQVLIDSTADLVAADTTLLAAASAMHVHLIAAPFTPGPAVEFADLTPATFTGGAALNLGTGSQPVYSDPITGRKRIQLKEPAGGLLWTCTADPASPETIVGYCVTDNADAVTLGCELLDEPVTISVAGQGVSIPWIRLTLALDPWE